MNLPLKASFFLIILMIINGSGLTAQDRIPEVESLIRQMTLEEKIGQLNLLTPGGGVATGSVVSEDVERKIREGNVGGLFGVTGPAKVRQAQEIAVSSSRLKIPLLIGSDVIHGYKTTFPIPLGLASSWDMDLIASTAEMAAREATADGINWNFSPMVDIARDPRWGRIAEGAGEDPYLGSRIAETVVRAYQGDDLADPQTLMACVKHLVLYGAAEGGRDYNSVDMGRVKMYNQYLPPYQAAVEAGAASAMTSFNDIDGVPASGNKWMITDLLRGQWGFDGMVVSDYTSINEMIAHGLGDLQAVSALALNAGLDMDMVGEGYLATLAQSVREGKVSEAAITEAARRVLEAKYKLGLLNDPFRYSDPDRPAQDILSAENRELARRAATRSFVLLKNHNGVLPLDPGTRIALVGPLADSRNNMLGTWAPTGDPSLAVTIREGLEQAVSGGEIHFAKGANISNDPEFAGKINVFGPRIEIDARSPGDMLQEALGLARSSDVVVAVVGEATEMSGEAASRTDIRIPEPQKKLLRALAETGKPLVLVLMSGRPLVIAEEMELPASILQVWHPGVEAGHAVADVLLGKYNPSGKLTASWPRHVGQIPVYHSQKITGRPGDPDSFQKFRSNYLDSSNRPLLPFGFGLSYTQFEYSGLSVSKSTIGPGEAVEVRVTVTNTGDYDGEEVVQLYLRDAVRSITPPARQLKGFQKIFLESGASTEVVLRLEPDDMKFYNGNLDFVAEPGEFQIFVGGNSETQLQSSFTLIE